MSTILCFGEILWDCLPHGLFLGGAPFNVAYHLKQLGHTPLMLSALGNDWLGAQTLKRIRSRGLSDQLIHVDDELLTGTVDAVLDANGSATYEFADPVAWDRLPDTDATHQAAATCSALVFGSLALRHEQNRELLNKLLAQKHWLRVFDVNLRPPYDDIPLVINLARHCDVLKLNASELLRLTGHAPVVEPDADETLIRAQLTVLTTETGSRNICVTRGGHGALWHFNGQTISATTPPVTVRDTIGAGDAFTAALVAELLQTEHLEKPDSILTRACTLGAYVASQDGAQPVYDAEKVLANVA